MINNMNDLHNTLKSALEFIESQKEKSAPEPELHESVINFDPDWWPKMFECFYTASSHNSYAKRWVNVPDLQIKLFSRDRESGIFQTSEQAETYRKINNRYYELMDGVKLDWGNEKGDKHYFCCDVKDGDICRLVRSHLANQGTKFMTREIAETLRKEFKPEELKIWILGGSKK